MIRRIATIKKLALRHKQVSLSVSPSSRCIPPPPPPRYLPERIKRIIFCIHLHVDEPFNREKEEEEEATLSFMENSFHFICLVYLISSSIWDMKIFTW